MWVAWWVCDECVGLSSACSLNIPSSLPRCHEAPNEFHPMNSREGQGKPKKRCIATLKLWQGIVYKKLFFFKKSAIERRARHFLFRIEKWCLFSFTPNSLCALLKQLRWPPQRPVVDVERQSSVGPASPASGWPHLLSCKQTKAWQSDTPGFRTGDMKPSENSQKKSWRVARGDTPIDRTCCTGMREQFKILMCDGLFTLDYYSGSPANRLPRLPWFRISASVNRA